AAGHQTQRLRISHAAHSRHMDGMVEAFGRVAERLSYQPARIPVVSNLTGKLAGDELSSPSYWVKHVRHTVRVFDRIRTLHAQGVGTFLEVGPSGVLTALAHDGLTEDEREGRGFIAAIRRASGRSQGGAEDQGSAGSRTNPSEIETLTAAIGELRARGHQLDW